MNHLLRIASFFIIAFAFYTCSSDDNDNDGQLPSSEFAMTANINDIFFEANSPFGDNNYSEGTIWDYYPEDDYVLLQGRYGGIFGNPEINIWLKKSDIAVGTYQIEAETYETPPSHYIDLIDNANDVGEVTLEGTIVITAVGDNTVIGTFEFISVDEPFDPNSTVTAVVTDGTFNYIYQ